MNTFTKTAFTLAVAVLAAQGLYAQTKLTMPQKKAKPDKAAVESPQKATADAAKAKAAHEFTSPWPVYSAQDKAVFGQYVSEEGKKPQTVPPAPQRSPYGPEDDTEYTYIGFNQAAGLADDGTTQTGGMVTFNIDPFACDTVSSDAGVSPYSYMAKGKLYSFLPNMDMATGLYTSLTRTVYDGNTMQRLDQRTVTAPGEKSRMPYLIAYDDNRDVVYAISMGESMNDPDEEAYYLNILDTATVSLQRIGYLGGYKSSRAKGNFSPKAFTAAGGVLRVQNSDDSLYICEINPQTCEIKTVGRTTMPTEYVYGLQPMFYDVNQGSLIVNHYDFTNGTQYYKVAPYLAYGATDNILKTELIENAPTGFTWFAKRPEAENNFFVYTWADINDLSITVPEGSTTATVSFTVPTTDVDGNTFELPSWASPNVRCYVYVDNTQVTVNDLPSTITYGDKITFNLELTGGMHVVTVQLYPLYNELSQVRAGQTVVCGYDAPAMVGDPTLTVDGQKATITWTAPTEGRYADFGSTFDPQDITYTVVRDVDGKTVAEGITETTAEDVLESEEIQTYSYTIYATSHGSTSVGAKTNAVSAGQYLPLPYENEFGEENCLDGWTIINADNNGTARTWSWNYYYFYVTSSWDGGDDWLITPPFSLTNDKVYALQYDLNGYGDLRTTVGRGNTVEAQDNVLDEAVKYTTDGWTTREFYFRPSENGNYNFALHDYSVGTGTGWQVDNFSVKEIADASAPDRVRQLTVTPDANGALGATVTFTLPTANIDGTSVGTISKAVVYDFDGNELGSATNLTAGAEASVKVTAVHGWNDFKIVAVNENGEGWPVVARKFIGADTPETVQNLKIKWGSDRTKAVLSWDATAKGKNDGYVDPAQVTYTIYKYDASQYPAYTALGEVKAESSVEVEILDAAETQDQYVFGITAKNTEGESDYTRSSIVLGVPYELPVNEPFSADGIDYSPWILVAGKNGQTWTLDQGYYNDKIQPQNEDGLQLLFLNTGVEDGSGTFLSPIIDFTDAELPMMKIWLNHFDAIPEEAYVTVSASVDGTNDYVAVGDTVRLTGNNGWTEHVFNLSSLKGKKAQVALTAYVPDGATRVFADNWSIADAYGNDLALAAISRPYMPVVGDTANIAVTVTNRGAKTADEYSVLFNLNGETIYEATGRQALETGRQAVFNFTLPITAGMEEYRYSAQVMYDGDEDESNNESDEITLEPEQVDLPAPADLALTGDNLLTWTAPEAMDGREVTLDFEDMPAFMLDDMNGWTTYDGDGNLTMTFIQYYSNYWPYANQPYAWMTWSAREAGCPTAAMWTPYEGEKCLIHFGNYGADAEGRPSTTPDDDWFISPEVKGGTDFSFMTLSNDITSTIEVLASSTDRNPESFTEKVTTVTYSTAGNWQEVKTTLPADAKYVAIHTVYDGFGIMIDNIAYTEAQAPVLKGYNVYCDGEGVSLVLTPEAKAQADGTYAVSAIYNLGESALSNTVAVTTGIAGVTTDGGVTVKGGDGCITITGADGQTVTVYSAGGAKMAGRTAQATATIDVPAGLYIVKAGGKTQKVLVK